MRRKPRPAAPDLRQPWQIAQAARCACRGSDDLCPCQNAEEPWKYGLGGSPPPTREQQLERRIRELEGHVATLELQQQTDRQTIAGLCQLRDRATDQDGIADALSDSIDMDWTSSIGARAVVAFISETPTHAR
jgi:hypothetical protein